MKYLVTLMFISSLIFVILKHKSEIKKQKNRLVGREDSNVNQKNKYK